MTTRVVTDPDEWDQFMWGELYESVEGPHVIDTSRWFNYMEQVVRNKETGKFYLFQWREGATEYQEEYFSESDHMVTEVEPYQETVTKYRNVTK